ncbi:MAG TPA: hypothetical protein VFS43_42810 [Polyangiaceae bacterium]|nr:hypothetical protein [Polyangiaceae bacterium]
MAPLASASEARRGRAGRGARARGRRRALGLALAFAALGPPSRALAQSDAALAEDLFRRGRTLMGQNRVAEACAKFTDSHRLDPKLGTLLNLAVCHEKEGKTASAWAEFVEAASQASRSGQSERSRFARTKAQELEKRLVRVEFRVDAPAAEQTVSLGPKPIPSSAWGVPIPVDPGTYAVSASAPHKITWKGELVVPEKSTAAVPFAVPALADEPPAPPPPPPTATAAPTAPEPEPPSGGGNWRLPAGLVAGGVGLAGLAVGTVFGLRTLAKESDADEECEGRYCSTRGLELHDESRRAATVSTVGFAAGVVGLGLGTYFLLSSGGRAPGAPKAGALEWAPHLSRQGLGLQVEGTW